MELNLYKSRSITGCLKASYELLTDHIKPLLKQTWWIVLIYAVLMAISSYLRLPNKMLHDWGLSNAWMSFVMQTIVYLLAFLSTLVSGAMAWKWLNGKNFKKNAIVCSVYSIIVIVISSIWLAIFVFWGTAASSFFISDATKEITSTGILVNYGVLMLGFITLLLFLLPTEYVLCKVMMDTDNGKQRYWKTYKTGLRHIGGFILLRILSVIISCIIIMIVCIPAILLMCAQSVAQMGALLGDPLNLPGYFTPLIFLVITAAHFISAYIIYWAGIASLYLYGSYETQDIEKKKLIEQDETNKTALH